VLRESIEFSILYTDCAVKVDSRCDKPFYRFGRHPPDGLSSLRLFATFDNVQQFRIDFGHHLDLELNLPRYLWLPAPELTEQPSASDLSPDSIRLIRTAVSSEGMVILQETLGGTGLSAGREEFMDGSSRSDARWRGIVGDLVSKGILEETGGEGVYRLSEAGYEIADEAQTLEEASWPLEITLSIAGPPGDQHLEVESNRVVLLNWLELLTSAEVCISTQSFRRPNWEGN